MRRDEEEHPSLEAGSHGRVEERWVALCLRDSATVCNTPKPKER